MISFTGFWTAQRIHPCTSSTHGAESAPSAKVWSKRRLYAWGGWKFQWSRRACRKKLVQVFFWELQVYFRTLSSCMPKNELILANEEEEHMSCYDDGIFLEVWPLPGLIPGGCGWRVLQILNWHADYLVEDLSFSDQFLVKLEVPSVKEVSYSGFVVSL